jgi:hypothetical protein
MDAGQERDVLLDIGLYLVKPLIYPQAHPLSTAPTPPACWFSFVNTVSLRPGSQHTRPGLHHIIEFPAICEYPKV